VAASVLDAIAGAYREWTQKGFEALVAEYDDRAWLRDSEVIVRNADGAVRAAGRLAGVDESGRLLVDGDAGRIAVSAGEVTLRMPGGSIDRPTSA
jgi:BirA family biotin operon repressor/biotin-[acetyl-CoA-carboxylase] ligase